MDKVQIRSNYSSAGICGRTIYLVKEMTITDLTAVLGLIFGLIGSSIGVSNYLRDRARVSITLQWDMAMTGEDSDKPFCCITVTNIGRRPIFISHVALKLPKMKGGNSHFLIREGLSGQRLAEGDPPAVFSCDQEGLEDYARKWKSVIAQVSDSTGKVWKSKKVERTPSWASRA